MKVCHLITFKRFSGSKWGGGLKKNLPTLTQNNLAISIQRGKHDKTCSISFSSEDDSTTDSTSSIFSGFFIEQLLVKTH